MEHGATRNFQAEKLMEEEEKRIQQEREDEELNNPMKVSVKFLYWYMYVVYFNGIKDKQYYDLTFFCQVLENRTKDSKMEMEVLENLQELKELNQRQARVDFEGMIEQYRELERVEKEREKEEDEQETK